MYVRLKFNSQVYVNLTRYHWNRIIVELSAKYIDLLYLKCICHKRDKRDILPERFCVFFMVCFVCMIVCWFMSLLNMSHSYKNVTIGQRDACAQQRSTTFLIRHFRLRSTHLPLHLTLSVGK